MFNIFRVLLTVAVIWQRTDCHGFFVQSSPLSFKGILAMSGLYELCPHIFFVVRFNLERFFHKFVNVNYSFYAFSFSLSLLVTLTDTF